MDRLNTNYIKIYLGIGAASAILFILPLVAIVGIEAGLYILRLLGCECPSVNLLNLFNAQL